eukprot:m.372329 g.372329  ORF g.372329 m.372329 type:complete len:51 (+) comp20870_c0_seq6:397-549(+)
MLSKTAASAGNDKPELGAYVPDVIEFGSTNVTDTVQATRLYGYDRGMTDR